MIPALLQQLAETLNALQDAGYTPDPRNGVHIGPGRDAVQSQRVVIDDETGRWVVAAR